MCELQKPSVEETLSLFTLRCGCEVLGGVGVESEGCVKSVRKRGRSRVGVQQGKQENKQGSARRLADRGTGGTHTPQPTVW